MSETFNVAVIGSAGRKEDAPKMNKDLYNYMFRDAKYRITKQFEQIGASKLRLHCGTAAWADHICVSLYKAGMGDELILHMPAQFSFERGMFSEDTMTGKTANYYHKEFSAKLGKDVNTLASFSHLMLDNKVTVYEYDGFMQRNIGLGQDVDFLLAYTWATGLEPKERSGTAHCWQHSTAKMKTHVPLDSLIAHYGSKNE